MGWKPDKCGLTHPSSGRATAGFAHRVPPLMSNVRAREPVGPCHAVARVLVDTVKRRVPRHAQEAGTMNTKGLAPAKLGCMHRRGLPVLRRSAGERRDALHVRWLAANVEQWRVFGPCRRVGAEQERNSTWGGRVVEGCSHIQQQASASCRPRRAWSAPSGPCAATHRSNPSFERTCLSWLRQLRPAAQVQR